VVPRAAGLPAPSQNRQPKSRGRSLPKRHKSMSSMAPSAVAEAATAAKAAVATAWCTKKRDLPGPLSSIAKAKAAGRTTLQAGWSPLVTQKQPQQQQQQQLRPVGVAPRHASIVSHPHQADKGTSSLTKDFAAVAGYAAAAAFEQVARCRWGSPADTAV
jgi:hypothetical protein